jgi:hypothetical protein
MTDRQLITVIASMVILFATTLLVQFNVLRDGKLKTVIVFLTGVAVILCLWGAGLPPFWFAGGKAGFGITGTCLLSAFVSERTFGRPLFLGLGLTLLRANVIQLALNML